MIRIPAWGMNRHSTAWRIKPSVHCNVQSPGGLGRRINFIELGSEHGVNLDPYRRYAVMQFGAE